MEAADVEKTPVSLQKRENERRGGREREGQLERKTERGYVFKQENVRHNSKKAR